MTLAEWAEAAEVKLTLPNDKGRICIEIGHLDMELKADLLLLDDYFLQSPPRFLFYDTTHVWMRRRAQVLDRAPQPQEAPRGQDKARTRRAT